MVRAIEDLVSRIDPAVFEARFGAGIEQLDQLVAAQTVTIASLMEIAPEGTIDLRPLQQHDVPDGGSAFHWSCRQCHYETR